MYGTYVPDAHPISEVAHILVPYTRGRGISLGMGAYRPWPRFISVDEPGNSSSPGSEPQIIVPNLANEGQHPLRFIFETHSLNFVVSGGELPENPLFLGGWLREWFRLVNYDGHVALFLGDDTGARLRVMGVLEGIGEPIEPKGEWDYRGFHVTIEWDHPNLMILKKNLAPTKQRKLCPSGSPITPDACLLTRYGAIGDCIQIDSVIEALHERGHKVWMNTSEIGEEVLRHHPCISDWWLQDKAQVPNEWLEEYWKRLDKLFPKTINLSETIEGTLLLSPASRRYALPHESRHRLCDHNYVEFLHEVAGVPDAPKKPGFRPNELEIERAKKLYIHDMGGKPEGKLLVVVLAGSSIHKCYPHLGQVVTDLLTSTSVTIVFLGDSECRILEHAIEQTVANFLVGLNAYETHHMPRNELRKRIDQNLHERAIAGGDKSEVMLVEQRLRPLSGCLSIRAALSIAQAADVLLGPETGITNSVGFNKDVQKVILLSHSSEENFTRDFNNTTVLKPKGLDCYPCHKLHFEKATCNIDASTQASKCAAGIPPEEVTKAVRNRLGRVRRR